MCILMQYLSKCTQLHLATVEILQLNEQSEETDL